MDDTMMYDERLYRELDELPSLDEGYADDLKIDTDMLSVGILTDYHEVDAIRVWTHRPMSGYVNAERRVAGRWMTGTEDDIAVAVAAARLDGLLP